MILKTVSLTKYFGGLKATDSVNFAVQEGEIRSIIGPNGAGKTTFFNLLTGYLKPNTGKIFFRGEDITDLPQYLICRKGIVKSFQITSIFPKLTVFENVRLAAQMRKTTYSFWKKAEDLEDVNDRVMQILEEVRLTKEKDSLAANLSYGLSRHLEIAISLATNPEILLLDEPTAGMNPEETQNTMHLIKKLKKDLTIVLVEHDMKVVMGISDFISVLHNGKILVEGSPDEIRNNNEVQRVYLGGK